jgi:menaquinone-dependent protoporphyrinogen IX oxidase
MRVLVTAAGSQASTSEIGTRIGSVLGSRGHQVDICRPNEVVMIDSYDVVVLGSVVDHGCWQPEARELVTREVADLSARPVWLFSTETCGEHAVGETSVDVSDLMRSTHAYEHRVFSDGDDVDRWAVAIADSISSG